MNISIKTNIEKVNHHVGNLTQSFDRIHINISVNRKHLIAAFSNWMTISNGAIHDAYEEVDCRNDFAGLFIPTSHMVALPLIEVTDNDMINLIIRSVMQNEVLKLYPEIAHFFQFATPENNAFIKKKSGIYHPNL